jgi:hypothetical protein
MEAFQYSVEEAERLLAEGSPGAADLTVREALTRDPRDARAWSVLSRIAAAVGERDAAERFARVAQELAPPAAPPAPDPQRFLLIKAWGYGFCSDLDHVLGALLLAEITGRTPVTHWGTNSLFIVEQTRDAFRQYFDPVSPLTIDDLTGKGYDFWPPKWRDTNLRAERVQKQWGEYSRLSGLQFLNRPERVAVSDYYSGVAVLAPWIPAGHPMHRRSLDEVYRYLFAKYLRPVADIRQGVEDFAAAHFHARPIIAVHVRGADKYVEDPQLQQKIAACPQAIDFLAQGNPNARVFLLTDSTPIVTEFSRRYGPRLITTDSLRSSTQQGLHYQAHADRRRLGVEVLRDIYLAARCDKFVGIGSSNVSCMISNARAWAPGTMVMLGPMMSARTQPMLYMSFEQLERYMPAEQVANWKRSLV